MKFFQIMRPAHWTKSVFVFAGLVFGKKLAGTGAEVAEAVGQSLAAFVGFCLISSAVYIFNDLMDRQTDQMHPQKSRRPIASGEVSVKQAWAALLLCLVGALAISLWVSGAVAGVLAGYFGLMLLYSTLLKRIMILDCVVIAVGFCLRAIAGAMAVDVEISPWLIICTFAICLFLSFGKRRSEIAQLSAEAQSFRSTLTEYTPELLGHMLSVTSALAIMCFLLYATDDATVARFGSNHLVYTTPLVLFCVFRFSALIQIGKYSGPVQFILGDRPFQIGFILWALSCVCIIY
ncbi:MAG: decaprenyl-phosphate phosphoribosyltransferase [Planctomycetes bacterium]|nr:decaprenyl-phosphate phosphoribosyltransferase [Planctomycetota bacterium]